MSILNIEELKALMETERGPCVSIYMPTHRHIPETEQDPIRFKNLLTDAEQRLNAKGMRSSQVRGLLAPAYKMLNDSAFWKFQSDALSVFLSAEGIRHYRLPFGFIETLVVGERFHLKPLWQVMATDQRYYILAISQRRIRMLEATGNGAVEVSLKDVPDNIAEILDRYDFEEQLQFHTRAQSGAAVFHGQGLGQEDAFKRVGQYVREVESGVSAALGGGRSPLVVAGDKALIALYRDVNTYPCLAEESLFGNPDRLEDEDLMKRTREIAQPMLMAGRQAAADKFLKTIGTGMSSNDLKAAVSASYHGRVESIFVPVGVQRWGRYEPADDSIVLHDEAAASDNDLLDFAARHTWLNNGDVYVVGADQIPGGGLLAAVHRF